MIFTRGSKPGAPKRPFSLVRLVANIAWIIGIGSILAPALLDLSASGRDAAQVVGGLALFAFAICCVVGIIQVSSHQRNPEQASAADRSDGKHDDP